MRKKSFLCGLLSILGVVSIIGGVWNLGSRTSVVCAVKTVNKNDVDSRKKIKRKIRSTKKVLSTVANQNRKIKKWQRLMNEYINVKEKGLKDFEDNLIENLVHDLNQNISQAKYIMKLFGCSDHLLSLIFEDNEYQGEKSLVNIKFKKIVCCPEIIVQIDKKFNSAEKLKNFREKVWNEKVFLCPNKGDNVCRMCVILINTNIVG